MTNDPRVLLIILDGFGEAPDSNDNAITQANMSFLNELKKIHPHTTLHASGNAVGLPEGVQGNSEVGHFTMGSGRITFQSLEAINRSIKNGDFFKNETLINACHVEPGKAIHLIGMISDEGVHSHINHLFALMKLAQDQGASQIYIHGILDGRDVPERSAHIYIKALKDKIAEMGAAAAALATLIGRYYAMDRDENWDRTRAAYDLLIHGKGQHENDPFEALKNAYKKGTETDYYVPPIVLNEKATIREGDSVIFFNYRTDRTRQLADAILNKKFEHFPVKALNLNGVVMGPYTTLVPVAFPAPLIRENLADTLAHHNLAQLHLAETEKYAHVTYFFNSQIETPKPLEVRLMVDSPKCASYAEKPEMSAKRLTKTLIEQLTKAPPYPFIVVNYANPDLVGHSGKFEAAVKACQTIDECLAQVIPAAINADYTVLITADHGNAEQMSYDNGEPCPAHTTNDVPLILITKNHAKLTSGGGLQDIAPTILDLMNLAKPTSMTGNSLLTSSS